MAVNEVVVDLVLVNANDDEGDEVPAQFMITDGEVGRNTKKNRQSIFICNP